MSAGHLARQRSSSSGTKPPIRSNTPLSISTATDFDYESESSSFQPCAATASIFLFAQGKSVICLHHDSLAVERRFEKHKKRIVLLEVDNVSERGAGRLVVSYDEEQTAIVWDLFTGDEITRFASFDPLRVAAWMKNGNVAFGNSQGHVMLFEPSTSEHRSARTIFDPITSIAPAADCQTYAIGYQNGSILIVSLLPNFTILHTLSTSGAPSPIVSLAWHASSSKQKSDMLAVQSANGDLRVWSISKPPGVEVPKVIRVLKRGDNVEEGLNWIAWSKNGRILQFSQGETWAWDVRTKHVAYEPVPTIEGVKGLANFGPGASLFTLGPNDSVQQYDLSPPALVKNVRHDPGNSGSQQTTPKLRQHAIPGAAPPIPSPVLTYKSIDPPRGASSLSTIQRATQDMSIAEHARQMRNGMGSPVSTASRTESINSRSSTGRRDHRAPSVSSRAASGTTFSTLSPSIIGRESTASPYWPATVSVASSGRRSKSSRLRNEVVRSPEGNIVDLFPYTRARLARMPYAPQPAAVDPTTASADQLRMQMLDIVFGWQGDIEPMIRDEMSRHPPGSMNATLLSKWLGEVSMDMMSMMNSESVSQNDWMLLALTSMNGQGAAGQQMGRTFAQRLISQGDIHTAATIYLGIKDFDEAVDIYVSRNYFMEGILLTCLLFPVEWQRQAHLVRRWGEFVVENSQQHLAIRCFTCTGTDTSLPWASPSTSPFSGNPPPPSLPMTLSPPNSPPPHNKLERKTTKTASLKLITTFGPADKSGFKFPGLKTDDRTPTNAPGVTPIAESALSPGGTPSTYLRPREIRGTKTPGGHGKERLPSIGETPIDVNAPLFPPVRVKSTPTLNDSGSDVEKESGLPQHQDQEPPKMIENPPLTLSAAVYNPKEEKTPHATPQTAIPTSAIRKSLVLSNSEANYMSTAQERSQTRNGSRDRKPNGLHIQMPSLSQLNLNAVATGGHETSSPRSQRRKSNTSSSIHSSSGASGRWDLRYDTASPPVTGQSWASSVKSPSVSGRSIDPYISSLDEANFHAQKQKDRTRSHRSREGRSEKKSKSRNRSRQPSEERGRAGTRYIRPAKRSPSSPVPMSPEDLDQYRGAHSQSIDSMAHKDSSPEAAPRQHSTRRKGASKNRSVSKFSEASKFSEQSIRTTVRHQSPDGLYGLEKPRSRVPSRRHSPLGYLSPIDGRGRSKSKAGGSIVRSPSSPLPMAMSPQAAFYQYEADEMENSALRLVEANRDRVRSRQRSTSRRPHERGVSARREQSTDRRRMVPESSLYQAQQGPPSQRESPRSSDFEKAGSDTSAVPRLSRTKSHRSMKKEMAARELEARRESLTARTMAAVAKPSSFQYRPSMMRSQSDIDSLPDANHSPSQWRSPDSLSGFSQGGPSSAEFAPPTPPERTASAGPFGLPATPRAMRHPRYTSRDEDIPAVPVLPDAFYATGQPRFEPSRSMSAPVPEPDVSPPADMPAHPAFHRNLRPSTNKRPNFQPLNDIGRQRRPSVDNGSNGTILISPPAIASIGETLDGISEAPVIDVPVSSHTPPAVIPELQHLANIPPPPPPPPQMMIQPPPMIFHEAPHHSLSSGSGVGTINILMDDESTPQSEVAPRPPTKDNITHNPSPPLPPLPSPGKNNSPPLGGRSNASVTSLGNTGGESVGNSFSIPKMEGGNGHRRGRSIDHLGSKITRMADRMRSTSRGRIAAKSPKPVDVMGPSPYETKLESSTYF